MPVISCTCTILYKIKYSNSFEKMNHRSTIIESYSTINYLRLLLFVLVVLFVMAAPATNENSCVEDTKAIIKNSFELAKEVDDLEYWIYLQRLTSATVEPNIQLKNKIEGNQSLCTIQDGADKVTCVIDYLNYYDNTTLVSNTKNNWCLNTPQTMYVETTYIYK